jgi:hypothetical protein
MLYFPTSACTQYFIQGKKKDNFSNILLMSLLALNQFLLIKITMTGSSKKAIAKVLLGYQQSRGLQQLLNVF